jgi:hypothetical protein
MYTCSDDPSEKRIIRCLTGDAGVTGTRRIGRPEGRIIAQMTETQRL